MVKPRKEQLDTLGGSEGETYEIDAGGNFIFTPNANTLAGVLAGDNITGGYDISMSDGDAIIAPDGHIELNALSTGANPALINFQEVLHVLLSFHHV